MMLEWFLWDHSCKYHLSNSEHRSICKTERKQHHFQFQGLCYARIHNGLLLEQATKRCFTPWKMMYFSCSEMLPPEIDMFNVMLMDNSMGSDEFGIEMKSYSIPFSPFFYYPF